MFARAILAASLFTAKALAADPTFPYGQEKVRGVNLGGWLVLEPFITPSLFDRTANDAIVDEFTFGGLQDHDFALSALKKHWDTWITEDDFADIAAAGLNHVRLPVGFWAWDVLDSEPYIQGQLPYVRKAVKWARNHGLKIVLDLHGAPGSQNGFDNSGQRLSGGPEWNKNQTNIDRTSAVIKQIVAEFAADVDTIPTIAPLNEPAGYFSDDLLSKTKAYWKDSYANIRNPNGKADTNIVELIHDAFQDINSWTGFMPESKYPNVAIDVHKYQIFSDAEVNRTEDEHIDFACETGRTLSTFTDNPVIVGEWSTAYTDCAKWLNGRGKGARYDGTFSGETAVGSCDGFTGPASKLSEETKTFMRKYWEAQVTAWEMVDGWIQWTWKTESAADWSYQAGLKGGWIPRDPTERKYGNLCAKTNAVVQII